MEKDNRYQYMGEPPSSFGSAIQQIVVTDEAMYAYNGE